MRSILSVLVLGVLCICSAAQTGPPFQHPNQVSSSPSEATPTTRSTESTRDHKATRTRQSSGDDESTSNRHQLETPTPFTTLQTTTSSAFSSRTTTGLDGEKTDTSASSTGTGRSTAVDGITQGATLSPSTTGLSSNSVRVNDSDSSGPAKIGLGVGLGLGIPLIAGLVYFFFIRRRRNQTRYSSGGVSAQHLRSEQNLPSAEPAMSSTARDMGGLGMAAMDYRDSKHSLHQTLSHHSMVTVPEQQEPPIIVPPPPQQQHGLTREPSQRSLAPSRHSAAPSLGERESLMPTLPPYDEAPSPIEQHDPYEPASPVSPISPIGSRAPSPLHDYER